MCTTMKFQGQKFIEKKIIPKSKDKVLPIPKGRSSFFSPIKIQFTTTPYTDKCIIVYYYKMLAFLVLLKWLCTQLR